MAIKIMVPFWGTLNIRGRIITGTQKGTIILTTTHMVFRVKGLNSLKLVVWGSILRLMKGGRLGFRL